jgi:hypothetical protein
VRRFGVGQLGPLTVFGPCSLGYRPFILLLTWLIWADGWKKTVGPTCKNMWNS